MKDFKVFDMGVQGVNLVKDPLELASGEVTSAQNAEPFREQGLAGIRKRLGLQRVVPTGLVAPGVLDGPPGLLEVIEENYLENEYIYGGLYSDDRVTWTAFTLPTSLLPNTIYDLRTGGGATYDVNLTPLLPAVWFNGAYYFGGHLSGQLLVFDKQSQSSARPGNPDWGARYREATRLVATGSNDDVYPLPGIFSGIDDQAIVISIVGGGVQLYYPSNETVKKLPTLPATATGSATYGGRLWVVAGLSLYTIDPAKETAWTTSCTVSDAGIAALTGLSAHNGSLYAGSRTNAIQPVRVYKFSVIADDWTATAATSASVIQNSSPSYMYGPYPQTYGQRVWTVYKGSAPFATNLQGSLGNAESMAGVSTRVLSLDTGTPGPWHNGVDTSSDDVVGAFCGGSSNRTLGPIQPIRGLFEVFLGHIDLSGDRIITPNTVPFSGTTWNAGSPSGDQNVTSLGQTIYRWPMMSL